MTAIFLLLHFYRIYNFNVTLRFVVMCVCVCTNWSYVEKSTFWQSECACVFVSVCTGTTERAEGRENVYYVLR